MDPKRPKVHDHRERWVLVSVQLVLSVKVGSERDSLVGTMRDSLVLSVDVKSGRDYLFESAKDELVGANRSGQILVLLVDVESERREFLIESARDKFVGAWLLYTADAADDEE